MATRRSSAAGRGRCWVLRCCFAGEGGQGQGPGLLCASRGPCRAETATHAREGVQAGARLAAPAAPGKRPLSSRRDTCGMRPSTSGSAASPYRRRLVVTHDPSASSSSVSAGHWLVGLLQRGGAEAGRGGRAVCARASRPASHRRRAARMRARPSLPPRSLPAPHPTRALAQSAPAPRRQSPVGWAGGAGWGRRGECSRVAPGPG